MTEITRAAILVAPKTADEETRSCELIIASEAITNGLSLKCKAGAVDYAKVVPVMLDHENHVDRMCGRIESIRFDGGRLLGTAVFTDAPSAEIGWQLARSGCAVSVGASYSGNDTIDRRTHYEVLRWRLDHAALVAQPADTNCVTRSAQHNPPAPETMKDPTAQVQSEDQPIEISRAALKRENVIRKYGAECKLPADQIQEFVDSDKPIEEIMMNVVRAFAARVNAPAPAAGHPVYMAHAMFGGNASDELHLETVLRSKMGDKSVDQGLKTVPLFRSIEATFRSHNKFRGFDWQNSSPREIVERAFSTSDFTQFLESASNRTVLSSYNTAPQGLRALSRTVQLQDFRPESLLRVSEIGPVTSKAQGAEYSLTTLSEELAATLKAQEYGRIVTVTRQAVLSDDLGMWEGLGAALGRGAARAEGALLAQVLAAHTFTAANSVSAAGIDNAVTAGAIDLRRQTGPNGELLSFEPGVIVVSPELEAPAFRYLADFNPTTAAAVSPFRTMQFEVDAQLPSNVCYMADVNYKPLVIGTIGSPSISSEDNFSTGARRFRVQHDFHAVLADTRSIVRLTVS